MERREEGTGGERSGRGKDGMVEEGDGRRRRERKGGGREAVRWMVPWKLSSPCISVCLWEFNRCKFSSRSINLSAR